MQNVSCVCVCVRVRVPACFCVCRSEGAAVIMCDGGGRRTGWLGSLGWVHAFVNVLVQTAETCLSTAAGVRRRRSQVMKQYGMSEEELAAMEEEGPAKVETDLWEVMGVEKGTKPEELKKVRRAPLASRSVAIAVRALTVATACDAGVPQARAEVPSRQEPGQRGRGPADVPADRFSVQSAVGSVQATILQRDRVDRGH